jgi:hypothetical protein
MSAASHTDDAGSIAVSTRVNSGQALLEHAVERKVGMKEVS